MRKNESSDGRWCGIDFGTSNSAVARVSMASAESERQGVELAALESGATSMPTAVFYNAEDNSRAYGRAAIAAYVDGHEGRLMRSIKSILGSDLMDEATELPNGIQVRYLDVVIAYLRHLKQQAEAHWGSPIERVVIGRPVFFVDDEPKRDARAQERLSRAAAAAGIQEVQFQFEPIAAALDYESRLLPSDGERLVLVADIGGGTSDFSLVRASAAAHAGVDRRSDVLANHGVHIAGTDFDRAINLGTIMPILGYGGVGPGDRPVPSKVYFDLATWHLINTSYAPKRMAELRLMRAMYNDALAHARLMRVLERQRGHDLSARAEAAKIDVSERGAAEIWLDFIEPGLRPPLTEERQKLALAVDLERIVAAARETLKLARVDGEKVDALYFTGGSTGLHELVRQLSAAFPSAQTVRGDRYASVVSGLAITAARQEAGRRSTHTR